eukprot:GHVU01225163.1.p2 GENE.GHVU01225163.1~~GHVU01225163.1.p2  ORF type:complete len:107 (+),score=4.82 GHVU01225163.1:342-662(+)
MHCDLSVGPIFNRSPKYPVERKSLTSVWWSTTERRLARQSGTFTCTYWPEGRSSGLRDESRREERGRKGGGGARTILTAFHILRFFGSAFVGSSRDRCLTTLAPAC